MIYTCTTNPSLDYYIDIDTNLNEGKQIRSSKSHFDAGGKGVNVSIVLSNLNIPSACLGFLGGFVKDYYLSFIKQYNFIQPLFTSINENTRINLKLLGNEDETSINMIGPNISDEDFNKFEKRISNIYSNDIFVLNGNVQDSLINRMIDIVHTLANQGVKIVLDTNIEIIEACLDIKPYLVNMSQYFDHYSKNEIIQLLKNYSNKGIKNAFYIDYNKSTFLVSKEGTYSIDNSNNKTYSPVGYVDAFVAGFLYATIKGGNSKECLEHAKAVCNSVSVSIDNDALNKLDFALKAVKVIDEKDN